MKEICIPINKLNEAERAELEIRLSDNDQIQRYRLESVNMTELKRSETISTLRVERLQQYISSYSNEWELIQIMDSSEGANYIHLLYRKRT